MIEKRYFKRMWEEEYYIFDSETISENEFDEKVEYEDYQAFADSMQGDEVVNKLNQLNDENEQLKHRLAISEKANFVTALAKENEQLNQRIKELQKESYGNLDGLNYYQEQNGHLSSIISDLECENEQLKQELFESEKECIMIDYRDNPIRRDDKIIDLKEEYKERFGRNF